MKVEVDVPNGPYGLCGRKATLNLNPVTPTRSGQVAWRWRGPLLDIYCSDDG